MQQFSEQAMSKLMQSDGCAVQLRRREGQMNLFSFNIFHDIFPGTALKRSDEHTNEQQFIV
jgi:hypothetical protein